MEKPVRGDKVNIVKLAFLYVREGQWDKAVEEYRKLLEMDPEDMNLHKMLGDVYVRKNAPALACEEYAKVAAHFTKRGEAEKAAAMNRKIATLDKGMSGQKNSLPSLRNRADEAIAAKDNDKAIELLKEALAVDPEDQKIPFDLLKLEIAEGRLQDSVARFNQMGESLLKSHSFKKAVEVFKKMIELEPDNRDTRLRLAQIYERCNQENDAKKEYLGLGNLALDEGDLDSAFEYASKAVELKSIEAQYILGAVLFKRAQWEEAKTRLESLLRIKSTHVAARVYLAKVYNELGMPEKAVETFQKALKADKDSDFALEAWAEYCVKHQDPEEAINTLTQLIEKSVAAKDYRRAIEQAWSMVSVDTNRVSSKIKLAELMEEGGDSNGAADVYYNLALMQEAQGKHEDVAKFMKKTSQLNPAHAKIVTLVPKEEPKKTAPAETIILNYATFNEEPSPVLAAEEPKAEQRQVPMDRPPEQAEVAMAKAFEAQMNVAKQCLRQGLLDEAIGIYQQLLEIEPDNAVVTKELNQVYTAYARKGTDLSKIFEPTSKPQEEARQVNLNEAKKWLDAIKIEAMREAGHQILKSFEKNKAAGAAKAMVETNRKMFGELKTEAIKKADQRMRFLFTGIREGQPEREVVFLETKTTEREKPLVIEAVVVEPLPVEKVIEPVAIEVPAETLPQAPAPKAVPVAAPVMKKKNKISYV